MQSETEKRVLLRLALGHSASLRRMERQRWREGEVSTAGESEECQREQIVFVSDTKGCQREKMYKETKANVK